MKKTIITVSLVILIIGIAILFGIHTSNTQQVELSNKIGQELIYTAHHERKWVEDALEPKELHVDIEDSLFNPMILRSFGDYLYVGDYGDMKIRRFLTDGRFVNEIGIGIGRGPGEFTQFMDFYVSEKMIFILDLNNLMVNKFEVEENLFIDSFGIEFFPLRIYGVRDSLVIASLGGDGLFKIFDKDGNKVTEFGELIADQISNPLSVQGELVSIDNESGFVFVPSYASYLFYFNLNGETKKIIRTIDQREFLASKQRGAGDSRTVSTPETDMIVEGISKFDGLLYILYLKKKENVDTSKNESNLEAFIDVYDLELGDYKYSFDLPIVARDVVIKNRILYLIRDEDKKIIAFNMKM